MKTKICTTAEQSKYLLNLGLSFDTADMHYYKDNFGSYIEGLYNSNDLKEGFELKGIEYISAWSLGALLDLTPQRILRKDKVHDEMAYVPSYRRIITPTSIFYSDGNNTMDYIQFSYGENGTDLIDATFKMICWLFKNGYIKAEKSSL